MPVDMPTRMLQRAGQQEDVLDRLFADVDGGEEEVDGLGKVGQRREAVQAAGTQS